MSLQRRISWNAAIGFRDERAKLPAGLLVAKASINLTVRYDRRPLVVVGEFDRSAIMRTAATVAHLHQARYCCSWVDAMSVALKAAWGAAKFARHMAAH
ncbi:hypothetical protein [Methylobacterium sp. CM6246]